MFDHFNFLAPIYDLVIQAKTPQKLASLVEITQESRVLDVGGGTGRISQFFTEGANQIVVADLSFQMLGKSLQKNGLTPVNSHSEKLPFPENAFDRIIMVDALHHVCNQRQTAEELWRVIKPGGRIVIEEPDINSPGVKLVALAEKLALMRSHFLSADKIAALFKDFPATIRQEQEDHFIWVIIDKNHPQQ